jgi:hypothetical protein
VENVRSFSLPDPLHVASGREDTPTR